MCGRFSVTGDLDFYAEYFGVDDVATDPLAPSWNVAPTDEVYVVVERDGRRLLGSMRWGLIPHFAADERKPHINARLESVDTSPAFRESFARRRCLIPADGFYEWEPPAEGRHPHWIYRADGHPMAFAGIWSTRKVGDGWDRSCSIITTRAEGVIAALHDRMPVSLDPASWDAWLDRELRDPAVARGLVEAIDPELFMEHPVSRLVNSISNDGPELRETAARDSLF